MKKIYIQTIHAVVGNIPGASLQFNYTVTKLPCFALAFCLNTDVFRLYSLSFAQINGRITFLFNLKQYKAIEKYSKILLTSATKTTKSSVMKKRLISDGDRQCDHDPSFPVIVSWGILLVFQTIWLQ